MNEHGLRRCGWVCAILMVIGCGDDATVETGGRGGNGNGTAGTSGTGGTMMDDPDRFPWTMSVSLVQVDATSAGSLLDANDWCDPTPDNRGEFFIEYRLDPPGSEPEATLLDLELDAGGPTDRRAYGEMFRRTFTISSADETAAVRSTNSFEKDLLTDDNLNDFAIVLENIPPSLIDFTDDVGCAPFGYTGSVGRDDCPGGCTLTVGNRAKNLCFLETTFCIRNISPPDR